MNASQFQALVSLRKRPRTIPKIKHPDAQARRYARNLDRYTRDLQAITLEVFAEIVKPKAKTITNDAADDPAGRARDKAEAKFFKKWPREKVAKLADISAQDVERFHRGQFNAQMKEIVGVDVLGAEPWLQPVVDHFTNVNVSLIQSVPARYFDEIEKLTKEELRAGARWEALAETLKERGNVAESRAKLIARDQAGKFFGDLNATRQKKLGIDSFTWRTVNDNRVREEHEALNGQTFKWTSPPTEGQPGEPVNCRCFADPVIEGFADD